MRLLRPAVKNKKVVKIEWVYFTHHPLRYQLFEKGSVENFF